MYLRYLRQVISSSGLFAGSVETILEDFRKDTMLTDFRRIIPPLLSKIGIFLNRTILGIRRLTGLWRRGRRSRTQLA